MKQPSKQLNPHATLFVPLTTNTIPNKYNVNISNKTCNIDKTKTTNTKNNNDNILENSEWKFLKSLSPRQSFNNIHVNTCNRYEILIDDKEDNEDKTNNNNIEIVLKNQERIKPFERFDKENTKH